MLMKYNSEVVPLSVEGITDVDTYRDCLRTLHSQAVLEATTNFVPNRVLGASPPDISPLESLLPRSVHTTLAQLRSGHCRLLNSYKAHITSGISDVCGTTLLRTSVQLSKPSNTTYSARPVGQPGCGRRLPQPGQLTIGEELLGYHNNNNNNNNSNMMMMMMMMVIVYVVY